MSLRTAFLVLAAFCFASIQSLAGGSPHRIGGGVNYWVALEDLDSDVDEDGFSYVATYQYRPGLLGLGLDAELLPDRFGEDAYTGQAYLIVGQGLYAAVGAGIVNNDGDWADKPFYVFRVGLELPLPLDLTLDLNAHYRFEDEQDLENDDTEIDTDTVFLGGALRLGF